MPSRLRHRIDNIRFSNASPSRQVDPETLAAVSTAVRDQRTLRFDYGDAADRPPRHVEPHALVTRKGSWYLVAWDLGRADWRIFLLDKMTPKFPGGASFTRRPIPTGSALSFLAARAKGSDGEDVWPCHGEFLLDLPAADIAPWLGDGEMQQVSDTTCLVRIGSWSWAGLLSSIIRFDAPFTVLGPDQLIDATGALASRISAAHPDRRRKARDDRC